MNIVELKNVSRSFEDNKAVDDLSFSIPKGSLFGILGPNGAGKTTTIRMMTRISLPDSGTIFFNQTPLTADHVRQIGYLPEERGLYKKMKVGEQLVYLACLRDMSVKDAKSKMYEWFERFDIMDWEHKLVEELSKGMQQKLQFISTVIHEPSFLILDEPFSGLDPVNANRIRQEIFRLHSEGTTILFSTHRMEQVEEICHRIVLVNKGKNILDGAVSDIKQQFKSNRYRLRYHGELSDKDLDRVQVVDNNPSDLVFEAASVADSNQILTHLVGCGIAVVNFEEILPTLNDIFIQAVSE